MLFAKKPRDGRNDAKDRLGLEIEKLEGVLAAKKADVGRLEGRVKLVKEEYDATISSLMSVKRELNDRKLELGVVLREHKAKLEQLKGHDRLKGKAAHGEFLKTEDDLERARAELKEALDGIKEARAEAEGEREGLRRVRKERAEAGAELDEANARLYNARTELSKVAHHDGGSSLTPREQAALHGAGSKDGGVIEAASALVGTLKSKLGAAQQELDAVQTMLAKERDAHARTKKRLEELES